MVRRVGAWRRTAVVSLFVTDELLTIPLLVTATRRCSWREVLPLSLGAAFTGLGALAAVTSLPLFDALV